MRDEKRNRQFIGDINSIVIITTLVMLLIGSVFKYEYVLKYSVLIIFVNNLMYALMDWKRHIIYIFFHITIAVFLLGRFVVSGIFGYDGQYNGIFELGFEEDIVRFILIVLYISLLSLFISYFHYDKQSENKDSFTIAMILSKPLQLTSSFTNRIYLIIEFSRSKLLIFSRLMERKMVVKFFKTRKATELDVLLARNSFHSIMRRVCFVVFLVSIVFRYVIQAIGIVYFMRVGYHGTYLNAGSFLSGPLYHISEMYDVSFFGFMVLKPNKRYATLVVSMYLIDGFLALIAGRRMELMLSILVLITLYVFRSAESQSKKMNRRILTLGFIAVPILLYLIYIVGEWRMARSSSESGLFNPFLKLFYDQSVSTRVIGYAKIYKEQLPAGKFYSFGTIIEFIRYRLIGNIILGDPVPLGQSVDRAINGHLFSQAIAYLAIPQQYLQGEGTGSSYIAELFVDFSYFGIILGNIAYGYLMHAFHKWFSSGKVLASVVTLLMIRGFYFTPRSGFTSFLTSTFSLRQIATFVLIVSITYLLNLRYNQRALKSP